MFRRNDEADRLPDPAGDADDPRFSGNSIPLAALALALAGIPAVRGFDWLYRMTTGSGTLITRNPPLLWIPAVAGVIALACLPLKRYRNSRSRVVLIFVLFFASFWLGLGLFVNALPPRGIQ